MNWFLRLFPQFRQLEHDRLQYCEECAALREQARKSEERLDRAIDDYRSLIDALSLKANGRRIYGENPAPVISTREALLPQGRQRSRDIQRERSDAFYRKIGELTRVPGTPETIESEKSA
jgi:hypothetical protein